jgi:chromosomal replication initiator protein
MMQPGMMPAERVRPSSDSDPVARIRAELLHRIGEKRYQLWCDKSMMLAVDAERLVIGVGSPFLLSWMQKQFRQIIADIAQTVLGPAAHVVFEVDSQATVLVASEPNRSADSRTLNEKQTTNSETDFGVGSCSFGVARSGPVLGSVAAVVAPESSPGRSHKIRRLADLADFVALETNQLPLAAARQCLSGEGPFPLLYLYGGVGLGKTHLLEGICRELRKQSHLQNVVLLTAEAFANYFTQALRDHTLPGFRQKFRTADVLLVDDIAFFEGKRVIAEEFFHTITDLMEHDRSVILTGDRNPRLLTKLSPELTSRIVAGMVCRLDAPDAASRRQILVNKAARGSIEYEPDVFDYVAQRFQANVRELEGALTCLQTYGEMTRRQVTVSAAREILCDLERDCRRKIHLADIERAVCALFGLTNRELKSESRSRAVSQPRMLAMFLARKHTATPYSEIGQHFGGRNHSTVMSAERKVQDWLKASAMLQVSSSAWSIQEVLGTLEQQLLAG